jgi:hypothetical protein
MTLEFLSDTASGSLSGDEIAALQFCPRDTQQRVGRPFEKWGQIGE